MNVIAQGYLDGVRELLDCYGNSHVGEKRIMDFAIEYCEKFDLHEEYVACKLNPIALYGYFKSEGNLEKLKKVVDILNKKIEQ